MKIDDRVKHAGYIVQQKRDYWNNQGREPQKSRAKKWLDDAIAERGTITKILHNGYEVTWDNGSVVQCLGYRVIPAC